MSAILSTLRFEYHRHRNLADGTIAQLDDRLFFARPSESVNSPALVVKHLAGSMLSRWTDFLTADGEKPHRDRDAEFVISATDTRASLLDGWAAGWNALDATFESLTIDDLDRTIMIRGEAHTVLQALVRGLTHVAYHVGQILYVARLLRPDGEWLTIAPGKSRDTRPGYLENANSPLKK